VWLSLDGVQGVHLAHHLQEHPFQSCALSQLQACSCAIMYMHHMLTIRWV
jgi:hypothetical protein